MVTVEEIRSGYWLVSQFRNGVWRSTRFFSHQDKVRSETAPERAAIFAQQLIDEAAARYSTATMRVFK